LNLFPAVGTELPPLEAVRQRPAAVDAEAGGVGALPGGHILGDGRAGAVAEPVLGYHLLQPPENELDADKQYRDQYNAADYQPHVAGFFLIFVQD